jgi:hypothetical protein
MISKKTAALNDTPLYSAKLRIAAELRRTHGNRFAGFFLDEFESAVYRAVTIRIVFCLEERYKKSALT